MNQPTHPDPHDYARAPPRAEHLRQEAVTEFWRGADAAWTRVNLVGANARLARSTQRLQARLRRHRAGAAPDLAT
jgi:hypothetical protein